MSIELDKVNKNAKIVVATSYAPDFEHNITIRHNVVKNKHLTLGAVGYQSNSEGKLVKGTILTYLSYEEAEELMLSLQYLLEQPNEY